MPYYTDCIIVVRLLKITILRKGDSLMCVFYKIPTWYLITAIVVSLYHAYRGFRYYWLMAKQGSFSSWSTLDKVTVLCSQAAYLYAVCSLLGFCALLASYNLLGYQKSMNSIDTGSAVLIAFSFIIGVLGVSGELGQLVQQGKLPTAPR